MFEPIMESHKLPKEYSYRGIRNIHEGLCALYMAG